MIVRCIVALRLTTHWYDGDRYTMGQYYAVRPVRVFIMTSKLTTFAIYLDHRYFWAYSIVLPLYRVVLLYALWQPSAFGVTCVCYCLIVLF